MVDDGGPQLDGGWSMNSFRLSHFRIVSKIGEGSTGEVYRARDTKLERDVAIKVLPAALAEHPDRLARFEHEAKVLAALDHPNIAMVHGFEDRAIVMELVEGPTLADRLRAGPLPLEEALVIAQQVAEALEAAHEKGIVHRDLKPANIKAPPDSRVKVLDFGLATALQAPDRDSEDATNSPTLTRGGTEVGVILGTPAYMSPEQASGKRVDKRADIWSFGVVLWEMLTGDLLFRGETVSHTLAAVLQARIDFGTLPASTPPPIRELLRRCLDRDPKTRLRDVGEARVAIQRWLANPVTVMGREVRPTVPYWAGAAIGAVTLALGALSFVHFREAPPESAVVRFQIPAPEGASFGTDVPALSPDGRWIVFTASRVGESQLWLRALDALESRALPGTEGGSRPFWSPDGRFIGFYAGGKIKKVAASGGPPQVLSSLGSSASRHTATWNRDGVILFGDTRGLYRVPQAGGEPVPVTKADAARGESGHVGPQFLPDGHHFLYLAFTNPQDSVVYLGTLDGKERKRLVTTAEVGPSYAPPAAGGKRGHLLFLRENTVMALPLDPRSFDPVGDAFPLAEPAGEFFAVSENGVLAYHSGGRRGIITQLTWFNRAGKPLGHLGALAVYSQVALSSDAKQAAVSTGNGDLWLLDIARNIPTRFTFDPAGAWDPVWSPDGRRIAFSSFRDGVENLYWKDSSGAANEGRLLKSDLTQRPTSWSSDGRLLLYSVDDPKTGRDLWVLPDTGKPAPYLQSQYNETQGQFMRDPAGPPHWVAYTSDESGARNEIFVQSFPVGSGKFRISSGGGVQPRWRRDGRELFYIAGNGKLMAVDIKTAPEFEAGVPKVLFEPHTLGGGDSSVLFRYDVIPDGQRFLLISPTEREAAVGPTAITVVVNWTAELKH